ncbi:aliphatic sulfonate ABC transporter substrate-binding protein [Nostocaceae cyanobacterium CENA369]|uniref:Putative aliphatic sulfonates-binding protein n=1 Tax=Dendronalium phyllosphericum CENA369 TaxID=1725256 RepID=A0A8J7I8I3_9NOST|nr:aliphatic sulfonate ABC transporter substrate-binding protein [Dendronalium phyllosphericum]MBH8578115.1 aliphatic sulfonate ABC transporter substrate-binding protein [Dendronalium phyllosphericum CENA369]
MRLKRRDLLGLGISTAALAACGKLANSPSNTSSAIPVAANNETSSAKLRLGFQPPYVAVYALREQKLLEKAFARKSTNFEFRRMLSLKPVTEALSASAIDLGLGGTPIAALAASIPIKIIALVERSPKTHALLVLPNSPIKTIADLKGKKLGNPSGKSYYFAIRVLERAGLKDSDVDWVQIENDAGRAALLSGAIDVWGTWDPFYASAEVAQEVVPLVDGEGYQLNYVALFGRTDYIENNPETIQKFLQAYKQAIFWAKDNRQAAVDILVKENKLSKQAAALTLGRRNLIFESPNDEYRQELINQSQLLTRLGLIEQQPNWDNAIDTTLAKAVS